MRPVNRRAYVLAFALATSVACDPAPELTTAGLTLHTLRSCPVQTGAELRLRAAGDFQTRVREISSTQTAGVDDFPSETRWVSIEAGAQDATNATGAGGATAGALVALRDRSFTRPALMLPLDESCPMGDPLAAAPALAALAALPEGGLLIAGGSNAEGAASALVRLLLPGESLASQAEMLLRRAGASATRADERILVAGGGADARGPAHDTYEVFALDTAGFDAALSERLTGPRRDHGAALLPDGRVLLVGGRTEVGEPALASAELLASEGGGGRATEGALERARIAPDVLVTESGRVLIVGGHDVDFEAITEVERFDPKEGTFATVASLSQAPAPSADMGTGADSATASDLAPLARAAALEGDRIAWLSCARAGDCLLELLRVQGDDYTRTGVLSAQQAHDAGIHDLNDVQLLGLPDGRLLLTARRGATSMAWLIDPGRGLVEPTSSSLTPERLVLLEDSTVAELNSFGASLRRVGLRSALHDLAQPIDADALVLAAPDAFDTSDGELLAMQQDARADVGGALFGDVRLELSLVGSGRILLEPHARPAVELVAEADTLRMGSCAVAREGDAIRITRHGRSVTLWAGADTRRCEDRALEGHVGVALTLASSARVHGLSATRQ